MAHKRSQIRTAVVNAVTGLATTAGRVYASRVWPTDDSALPCLLVNTDSEQVSRVALGRTDRRVRVAIRAIAKLSASLDATLDQIALEVEVAMQANASLGGHAADLELTDIEIEMDALDKPVGVLTLAYAVTYFSAEGNPT